MNCCIISDLERYCRKFSDILNQMINQVLYRTPISDVSIDFCETANPLFCGIISMCQNVLQYTDNEELREFCNSTIESKNAQIEELQEIQNSTYGFINPVSDVNTYVSQYMSIARRMFNNMARVRCNCAPLTFIRQMICCLEGATCLCENCLQCEIDPRLRTLCENAIVEQNRGVNTLRQIWYRICNE